LIAAGALVAPVGQDLSGVVAVEVEVVADRDLSVKNLGGVGQLPTRDPDEFHHVNLYRALVRGEKRDGAIMAVEMNIARHRGPVKKVVESRKMGDPETKLARRQLQASQDR